MALTPEEEQHVKDGYVKAQKIKQREELLKARDAEKNAAIKAVNDKYEAQIRSLDNEI